MIFINDYGLLFARILNLFAVANDCYGFLAFVTIGIAIEYCDIQEAD